MRPPPGEPLPGGTRALLRSALSWRGSNAPGITWQRSEVASGRAQLATADTDPAFARAQLERVKAATAQYTQVTRHAANSAAALRIPESRLDAARCGIAIYGLSPFGEDPADDGLEPVLSWQSYL